MRFGIRSTITKPHQNAILYNTGGRKVILLTIYDAETLRIYLSIMIPWQSRFNGLREYGRQGS